MQVNRASALRMGSGSVRSDAAGAAVRTQASGIAPVDAAENSLSDEAPPRSYPVFVAEGEEAPERLMDAIDLNMLYRAAASVLRREGMVGLLLNRNA